MKLPSYIIPPGMTFWQGFQRGLVKPVSCPAYLEWVATLPCCVTGRMPVTVHHIIGHGLKGMGSKTSDFLAIPLVPELHQTSDEAIHVMGSDAWERKYGSQLEYSAQTLLRAIYDGVLTV